MTRRDGQRLDDIDASITAIASHLSRGELSDGLVFDAVRARLIEIGEAVKGLSPELLAHQPDMPWADAFAHRRQVDGSGGVQVSPRFTFPR